MIVIVEKVVQFTAVALTARTFESISMVPLSHLSFVLCEQVKFRPKKKVKIKASHSVVAGGTVRVCVCVWGGGGREAGASSIT